MFLFVKRLAAAVAAVIVLVLAIFLPAFVKKNGGIREVLQLPATLASGIPVKQDGFALVSVTRGQPSDSNVTLSTGAKMFLATDQSSGDTVLWIAPPILPPTRLLRAMTLRDTGQFLSFYDIEVRSSAGDKFTVPWYYEGGCLEGGGDPCLESRTASTSPHIIATVIPAGYPSSVSYFDVSISDHFHHYAHWRIIHLPKSRQTLPQGSRSSLSEDGVTVGLKAVCSQGSFKSSNWPLVNLFLTVDRLSPNALHKWVLYQRPSQRPTLAWQPYKMPWMKSTSDENVRRPVTEFWLCSHTAAFTSKIATLPTPYARDNSTASFHGFLSQYEAQSCSFDIKDVAIERIRACEGGMFENADSISLPKKVQIAACGGLTFTLPKQRMTPKTVLMMTPDSLNLMWQVEGLSPSGKSYAMAAIPNSPLCKQYHHPALIWFEASADGKPLGIGYGLPDRSQMDKPIMVHFPVPFLLPDVIHNLKITVHERVEIKRIPVVLTAPIVSAGRYPEQN
jgi:hypothetical protein